MQSDTGYAVPAALHILPELPDLPTEEDWKAKTSRLVHRRSPELQALDAALGAYAASRTAYERIRSQFQAEHALVAVADVEDAFENAANAFTQAARLFAAVSQEAEKWGVHSSRNRRGAIPKLWKKLADGQAVIGSGRLALSNLRLERQVPDVYHLIWTGSAPAEDVMRAARIWSGSQPGAKVNVLVDRDNLLAHQFKTHTANLRPADLQDYPPEHDPAITARIELWASDGEYRRGLDDKLDASWDSRRQLQQQRLEQFTGRMQDLSVNPDHRINVLDMSRLWQHKSFGKPDELSETDRGNLQKAYQREVGERCNFAAGSDIARVVAIHDSPGLYVDIDIMPPVKGFTDLVSAWNAAAQQANVAQKIRLEMGPSVKDIEPYRVLRSAVEEHIDKTCLAMPVDGARHAQLLEYVDQEFGEHAAQVKQTFDAWASRVTTLEAAFERLSPVRVAPGLFKAFQSLHRIPGATNNCVLATVEAGSAALAHWGRCMVRKMDRKVATQKARRDYYNDRKSNESHYMLDTLVTTGPSSLYDKDLQKALKEEFGVSGTRSTLMTVPFSHFPTPSMAESDHSWLAKVSREPSARSLPQSLSAHSDPDDGESTRHPELPHRRSDSPARGSPENASLRQGSRNPGSGREVDPSIGRRNSGRGR